MKVKLASGWREQLRERPRRKQMRTGGSPEKLAQAQARGGAPDEDPGGGEKLSFVLAGAAGIFPRGQARETFRDAPPRGRQGS